MSLRLPHLFIIFIGPWEIVQKLGLEEDLLKLTEQRRTDDLGISRGHILGISTIDSLSSFKCLPSATIRATVLKAFISTLWLQRVSGPSIQIHRTLTMYPRLTQEVYWPSTAQTFRQFFSESYLPPTASTVQNDSDLMSNGIVTGVLSLFFSKTVQAPFVMYLLVLTE